MTQNGVIACDVRPIMPQALFRSKRCYNASTVAFKVHLFGDNNTLPVVISAELTPDHETMLLDGRLNPIIKEVVEKEIIKWFDVGIIHPISNSLWVSHIQCVPKKGGVTMVSNDNNKLISTHTITGCRVCVDYCKLNKATQNDHFPLPFINQMLDRLAGKAFYSFLNGYSGYNQIAIDLNDQEKNTFTCPYETFAF
ncbi:Retrovirus-related Pol polyprotein from transposon 17.6 [Gossypium australe]|uniref:Retrovirus-related Pol polyprotein from transposon 17.6 n=1 Tax=Gossypium australe TaxID=47621 RepID=A0A5B6X0Y1_9ROSI|nr:Retrovirus-related Pol polyprotein from transposon 17.6 [Gossypium australe]